MGENRPIGWIYPQLNKLISFVIGGDWGKDISYENSDHVFAYCIRGSEFKNWDYDRGITASLRKVKKISLVKRTLLEGDILIEISGGGPDQPVGRTVLIDRAVLSFSPNIPKICTNFLRLMRLHPNINSKYINYYLTSFYKSGEIVKYQCGSNNLRNLKFEDFISILIPLPPLNEQKRIVSKIEELLSELDHAVESFKKIQQQLKVYRQAVLKAAFEGKLTEQKESYTSPEELLTRIYKERKLTKPLNKLGKDELPRNWINCTISCLGNVGTGATPLKSKISYYENGDIPWITSTALNKSFVKEPTAYITKIALKETNVKIFPKHTLLIAMYGEGKTRGKCSELLIEASTNQAIAAITLEGLAEPLRPFLKWFLQKNYNDMRKMSSGGVQPNLNLGIIKNTQIPLPPLEEQNQIVQEIESRLSICDELEKTIEQNLILEKSLRQSILKKAFEGKLVPQDPNDEPAELLLEKIKLEKEKLANSSQTKTKREKVTA